MCHRWKRGHALPCIAWQVTGQQGQSRALSTCREAGCSNPLFPSNRWPHGCATALHPAVPSSTPAAVRHNVPPVSRSGCNSPVACRGRCAVAVRSTPAHQAGAAPVAVERRGGGGRKSAGVAGRRPMVTGPLSPANRRQSVACGAVARLQRRRRDAVQRPALRQRGDQGPGLRRHCQYRQVKPR